MKSLKCLRQIQNVKKKKKKKCRIIGLFGGHDGGLCNNGHYHNPEPSLGLISDNGQRRNHFVQRKASPLKTY